MMWSEAIDGSETLQHGEIRRQAVPETYRNAAPDWSDFIWFVARPRLPSSWLLSSSRSWCCNSTFPDFLERHPGSAPVFHQETWNCAGGGLVTLFNPGTWKARMNLLEKGLYRGGPAGWARCWPGQAWGFRQQEGQPGGRGAGGERSRRTNHPVCPMTKRSATSPTRTLASAREGGSSSPTTARRWWTMSQVIVANPPCHAKQQAVADGGGLCHRQCRRSPRMISPDTTRPGRWRNFKPWVLYIAPEKTRHGTKPEPAPGAGYPRDCRSGRMRRRLRSKTGSDERYAFERRSLLFGKVVALPAR